MSKFNFTDKKVNTIKEALKANTPIGAIAKTVGCQYSTLVRYLKKENIKYNTNQGRKGTPHTERRTEERLSAEEYLNSVINPKSYILIRLLEKERGYRKCEVCQNTEWNSKPIPLEIHHIDGNHNNKSISNILMVCPNCHAQTDNYKSKNMKR